jgi:hypothetical protein
MELCECGSVDTKDGCPNIHCKYNMCDVCPYCKEMGTLIGDAELLFECENRHIWSYHSCKNLGTLIGWILRDDYDDISDTDDYEQHEKFSLVKKAQDIDYEDLTVFVWKCRTCKEKYMNMMCG